MAKRSTGEGDEYTGPEEGELEAALDGAYDYFEGWDDDDDEEQPGANPNPSPSAD